MHMVKVLKLESDDGLHARPAGLFVKTLSSFKATVEVELRGQKKNGKSIMSLMSLGAVPGDELTISATGEDADKAILALEQLFASKFAQ